MTTASPEPPPPATEAVPSAAGEPSPAPVGPPEDPAAALFRGEQRPMTIGLLLVITLVAFEALAIATILPAVEKELGGIAIYGWAFSGFLLASLIGITWAGAECDARGAVRPFLVGMAFFSTGLVIAGAAPAMWVVVLGRVVQGLGAGAIPPVVYFLIARAYDERARPRIFALMASAWIIPGLIGPGIAGAVADYAHWRFVFAGLLPLLVFAAALTLPALRRLPHQHGAAVERKTGSALQLVAGAVLLLAAANTGRPLLVVPGVLIGALIAAPALRRVLPPGTFTAARGIPAGVLGMGLINMAFFGADSFLPLTLTDVRGQSSLFAGLAITVASTTWTAGTWTVERLVPRVERRQIVAVGLLVLATGIAAIALVLRSEVPVWWAMVATGISGLGMGLTYPCYGLSILAVAPPGGEGAASSALKLNEVLGAALGAGLVGSLVAAGESGGWQTEALGLGFGAMTLIALAAFTVAPRLPANADRPPIRSGHPVANDSKVT
jgi:MFS family permease